MENAFIVIDFTKYIRKKIKTIQVFSISLFILVRKIILSKVFSMSELDIYQSLLLNYNKKVEEW